VLITDNGSSDDSIGLMRARVGNDRRVRVIENRRNLGFAKAVNIALRSAVGDFCLVLNPDCVLTRDTLARAVSHFSADSGVGMVGCMIRNPDGSEQAGARRSVPTPWRSLVRVLHLDKWLPPHPRLRTFIHVRDPVPDRPIAVEAISGAYMLVQRKALVQVGLMDEGYFLHCEDLDWCMRFRRAGWKILFVPNAEIVHHKGVCGRSRPIFVEWHKHGGMVRFYGAHFRHQYPGPFMPFVAVAVWTRFLLVAICILVARVGLRRTPGFLAGELPSARATTRLPDCENVAAENSLERAADKPRWSGRTMLVTGGAGYIGRRLVLLLAKRSAKARIGERDSGNAAN
jgi:GT2 family glycosyltransferase